MAEKRKGTRTVERMARWVQGHVRIAERMAERETRHSAQEARDRHQATQCEACTSCERARRNAEYADWAERDHTIVVRPMTAREREQL